MCVDGPWGLGLEWDKDEGVDGRIGTDTPYRGRLGKSGCVGVRLLLVFSPAYSRWKMRGEAIPYMHTN